MTEHGSTYGRWLSLKQAASYCPYGEKKLIDLAKTGKVRAGRMPDNKDGWFFDRRSIDKYMEAMLTDKSQAEIIALDVSRRLCK